LFAFGIYQPAQLDKILTKYFIFANSNHSHSHYYIARIIPTMASEPSSRHTCLVSLVNHETLSDSL